MEERAVETNGDCSGFIQGTQHVSLLNNFYFWTVQAPGQHQRPRFRILPRGYILLGSSAEGSPHFLTKNNFQFTLKVNIKNEAGLAWRGRDLLTGPVSSGQISIEHGTHCLD